MFGWKPLLGTKLVYVGVLLFGTSLVLVTTDLLFSLEVSLATMLLGTLQLSALALSIVGITHNAMRTVSRNKWLTVVGVIGIMASIGVATLYGIFPLFEVMLGGSGSMVYEKLGLYIDTVLIPPLAILILFLCVHTLIRSIHLFIGQSRFQR